MRFVSTKNMSRKRWLELRMKSLGASDAGAIIGVSTYKSAVDLYYEKIDGIVDNDSLHLRLGREMEPILRTLFTEETGKRVRQDNKIRVSKKYRFLSANLDGVTTGGIPVELKTKTHWNGVMPDQDYCQLHHQMYVTGKKSIYYAVLVIGYQKQFIVQLIDRDDKFMDELIDAEINFWIEHILKGVPPEPVSPGDARKVWRNEDLISELGGDVVVADEEAEQIYKDMINIRGTMTDNRHLLEDMQLKIMVKMQTATSMRGADDLELFSWKQSKKGRRFLIK